MTTTTPSTGTELAPGTRRRDLRARAARLAQTEVSGLAITEARTPDEMLELGNRYSLEHHPRVLQYEAEQFNFYRGLSIEGFAACWDAGASRDGVRAEIGWCAAADEMRDFFGVYGRVVRVRARQRATAVPMQSSAAILDQWRDECIAEYAERAHRLVALLHGQPTYVLDGVPWPVQLSTSFPLVSVHSQHHRSGVVQAVTLPGTATPTERLRVAFPETWRCEETQRKLTASNLFFLVLLPHVASFEREQYHFSQRLSETGQAEREKLAENSETGGLRAQLAWTTLAPCMQDFDTVAAAIHAIVLAQSAAGTAGTAAADAPVPYDYREILRVMMLWYLECLEEFIRVAQYVHAELVVHAGNFKKGVALPRTQYDDFPQVCALLQTGAYEALSGRLLTVIAPGVGS
jgi:hypothetical protein